MEKRNRYTKEFKAKVVLEILREEESLNQIAGKYELNPQMLSQWKREFVDHAAEVFDHKKGNETKLKKDLAEKEDRYQKIVGQMSYEISWLKKKIWPRRMIQSDGKRCSNRKTIDSPSCARPNCSASTGPVFILLESRLLPNVISMTWPS